MPSAVPWPGRAAVNVHSDPILQGGVPIALIGALMADIDEVEAMRVSVAEILGLATGAARQLQVWLIEHR